MTTTTLVNPQAEVTEELKVTRVIQIAEFTDKVEGDIKVSLICPCGHRERKAHLGADKMSFDPFKGESVIDKQIRLNDKELHLTCSSCGNKATHTLDLRHNFETLTLLDYAKLYDNNEKISLSYRTRDYVYNRKVDKIGTSFTNYRYTFNATTGLMYLYSRKNNGKPKLRTITHVRSESRILSQLMKIQAMNAVSSLSISTMFIEFITLCIERRGINVNHLDTHYCQVSELLKRKGSFNSYNASRILPSLFKLLRYPVLINVPVINSIPVKSRSKLMSVTKSKDVFQILFGFSGKRLRKEINDVEDMFALDTLSQLFTKEDYIYRLLTKMVRNKTGEENMGRLDAYAFNEGSTVISTSIKMKETIFKGNEDMFFKAFMKSVEAIIGEGSRRPFRFQSRLRFMGTISRVFSEISDTMRMYDFVVASLPNYKLDVVADFRILHDTIMRDHDKIKHRNLVIPYTDGELSLYNRTIGDIEFRLAETTHRLVDAGTSMNICVGSYGDMAVRKDTTIVMAYKEDKYAYCIEVKYNMLQQVKSYRNEGPAESHLPIIRGWAKLVGVNLRECYDLSRSIKDDNLRLLEPDNHCIDINHEVQKTAHVYDAVPVAPLNQYVQAVPVGQPYDIEVQADFTNADPFEDPNAVVINDGDDLPF